MNNVKKCVQCGQTKSVDDFAKYSPRGNGIRQTEQGRHTVCRSCESFNTRVNAIYKKETKTTADQQALDAAAKWYLHLKEQGLEPKGAYAAVFVGPSPRRRTTSSIAEIVAANMGAEIQDSGLMDFVLELQTILDTDLTEAPEFYYSKLAEGRAKYCKPRIDSRYADLYDKAMKKLEEYDDDEY